MSDLEYARNLQEKFDFYFLALIFTLLGLAIQTAKFGVLNTSDWLELTGWIAMAVSGLTGLARIEWMPRIYKDGANKQKMDELMEKLQSLHREVRERALAEMNETYDIVANRFARGEQGTLVLYRTQQCAFLVGLLFLVAARAYVPLWRLLNRYSV